MGAGGDGCGVRQVQQWDGNRSLHLIGHPVHRVGTERPELRAGGLQPLPPDVVPRLERQMLNDHAGRPDPVLSAFQVGERECRRETAR